MALAGRVSTHPGWMGRSASKTVPSVMVRPWLRAAMSVHRSPLPSVCWAMDHRLSAGRTSRTVYVTAVLDALAGVPACGAASLPEPGMG
ncbi:hypothetical protein VR44_17685, partial [Streptomyces katrae]